MAENIAIIFGSYCPALVQSMAFEIKPQGNKRNHDPAKIT